MLRALSLNDTAISTRFRRREGKSSVLKWHFSSRWFPTPASKLTTVVNIEHGVLSPELYKDISLFAVSPERLRLGTLLLAREIQARQRAAKSKDRRIALRQGGR